MALLDREVKHVAVGWQVTGTVKHPALAVCCIQLAIVLPVTLVLAAASFTVAYSFLLGSVIFILPNMYFTIYAFRYRGAARAADMTRAFYWGESGKLILTMVGFAVVFRFVAPLHIPALTGAYILMIVSQWPIAARVTKYMTH